MEIILYMLAVIGVAGLIVLVWKLPNRSRIHREKDKKRSHSEGTINDSGIQGKRIKKLRPTRINEYASDKGIKLAGSFEELYEEVDLPKQASESGISTLYKFQAVGERIAYGNTTATQNVVNILKNCALYAATPAELNDPFEVTLPPGESDIENHRTFLKDLYEEFKFFIPADLRDETLNTVKPSNKNLDLVLQAILRMLEEDTKKSIRILSLTSIYDNSTMWSHYAGGHEGVCIGFRVKEENIFGLALEVQYREPPIYYTLAKMDKMTEEAIMTKTSEWSQEKEWRVIVANYTNPSATMKFLPFEAKDIAELIFGVRVNDDIKSTIISAVSNVPGIRIGDAISEGNKIAVEWRN